jgi:hypothetical protein
MALTTLLPMVGGAASQGLGVLLGLLEPLLHLELGHAGGTATHGVDVAAGRQVLVLARLLLLGLHGGV